LGILEENYQKQSNEDENNNTFGFHQKSSPIDLNIHLKPFFSSEVDQHDACNANHDYPKSLRIKPMPPEFRHVFEIHSVYPCYENQVNKHWNNTG
jgi:hypothetical protein